MVRLDTVYEVVTNSVKCPALRGKNCRASEKMFSKLKDVLEEIEELEGDPKHDIKYLFDLCRVWICQL